MKYLYKQTGVTVESGVELDPAVFKPVTEVKEEKPVKTATKRTAARTKK